MFIESQDSRIPRRDPGSWYNFIEGENDFCFFDKKTGKQITGPYNVNKNLSRLPLSVSSAAKSARKFN